MTFEEWKTRGGALDIAKVGFSRDESRSWSWGGSSYNPIKVYYDGVLVFSTPTEKTNSGRIYVLEDISLKGSASGSSSTAFTPLKAGYDYQVLGIWASWTSHSHPIAVRGSKSSHGDGNEASWMTLDDFHYKMDLIGLAENYFKNNDIAWNAYLSTQISEPLPEEPEEPGEDVPDTQTSSGAIFRWNGTRWEKGIAI